MGLLEVESVNVRLSQLSPRRLASYDPKGGGDGATPFIAQVLLESRARVAEYVIRGFNRADPSPLAA